MISWAIDLDGVMWRGPDTIAGSADAIAELRASGAPLAFVTNSSVRTPAEVAEKLARHGVDDAEALVVTSAMAAASLVEPGERAVVVGSGGLRTALGDRGVELVDGADLDDADAAAVDVVVAGLTTSLTYEDLTRAQAAIRAGARFVASNDDATYPHGDTVLPGAGSIVAAITVAGGVEPVVAGKPHAPIAAFVRERLGPEGVMVGDRPETDGLFARRMGYRFGLVLTGVTSEADLPVEPKPDRVEPDLATLVSALRES